MKTTKEKAFDAVKMQHEIWNKIGSEPRYNLEVAVASFQILHARGYKPVAACTPRPENKVIWLNK